MIDNGVAPSAFLTPISRVLSRTVISMMFETPTTPAKIVPIPTIHTNPRIAFMSPWIFANSLLLLFTNTARASSWENAWRPARRRLISVPIPSVCSSGAVPVVSMICATRFAPPPW